MERLINHKNVYRNIKNLLENENDVDRIVKRLIQYHFVLKNPDAEQIKEKKKELFADVINVYSKIAFYLLTRLNCYEYDYEIERAGFELSAFCFEIISKNGDLTDEDIEESKLLSAICYTLANNSANSIVMAHEMCDEKYEIYKLFFERNFKKIIYNNTWQIDDISTAVKKMAYSLVYKENFEEEIEYNNHILQKLRNNDDGQLYYFRLLTKAYQRMSDNSIRRLINAFPDLTKFVNVLTQKEKVYELWEAQKNVTDRLNDALDSAKISYISLPTSAGKTLLAELILYFYVTQNSGVQLYIVPSLALENEVKNKLAKEFRKVAVRVSNSVELDDSGNVVRPQIIVATPEKIDNYLRRNTEFFSLIDCVVIDEFHKVSSGVRGWFEEALAIWINYKREQYNYKIVLISAIADNVEDYLNMNITDVFTDIWAPTRKMYCKFVRDPRAPRTTNIKCREEINQGYNLILNYPESDDKYTIKNVFFQTTRGRRTVDGKDPKNSDTKADIAWKALSCVSERPLMVFFYWKRELERFVEKSALYMPVSPKGQMISNKLAQILGESHLLVRVLKRGVAYHNGDLPDDVRGIIESEFRKPNSSIKVLACTTTLADGVNLPAKAILMANVFTRTGNASFRSLDIGDYKNIVGRIGRALCDTEGMIYLIDYPEFYYEKARFDVYYDGTHATYKLSSSIDSEIGLMDDDELMTRNLEEYKKMQYLQLLIFSISEDFEDFEEMCANLERAQILKVTDSKRSIIQGYGRRYFNLAKTIDRDLLTKSVKTGVSYKTNIKLREIANELVDSSQLEEVITEHVYKELLSCIEFMPQNENPDHYKVFMAWIREESFKFIADIISDSASEEKYEAATKYIKNVFQYISPWMFGCLGEHIEEVNEAKRVIEKLRNQVRYGTQDENDIILCSKGIKSRELAISIVKIYYQTNSEEDIIHWLINVDDKLLYEQLVEVYDVSILEQIGKVRRDNKSKSSYFEKADRIKVSLLTKETENVQNLIADIQNHYLSLNHVKDNPFNEFRVEVVCGGKPIGYLPDIISEEVSEIVDSDEKLKCEFAESETDKIWMYISRVKVEV